jgi:hypothetical protein
MNAKNHFSWECRLCDDTWPTEEELDDHYIDCHNWCESCDRYFQNPNNTRAVRDLFQNPVSGGESLTVSSI